MRRVAIGCALALLGVTHADAQSDRLRVVDPLGGAWLPVRIGLMLVPPATYAGVTFRAGNEYSAQVSCAGLEGTYSLDGPSIRTRQSDPMDTSGCKDAASVRIGAALSGFMPQASSYAFLADGSLRIVARDGRAALFRRPVLVVPALVGRWNVERIGGDAIAPGQHVRVDFGPTGVTAVADCNQLTGEIKATPSGFAVGRTFGTEMGCGPERESFDERLFSAVRKARRHVAMLGGRLRLEGIGEPLVLRRVAAKSPTLPGTYRACRSNLRGVGYNGDPAVTFSATTVRDSAGCAGTYRANGALLDIKRDDSKICSTPPAVPDNFVELEIGDQGSVLALLRPDAYAFDEEGVLRLRTRRGILNLCRDGERRPFGSG